MARSSIAVSMPLDTEPKLAPTADGEGFVRQTSLHFIVCCVDSRDRPRARSMWSSESVGDSA